MLSNSPLSRAARRRFESERSNMTKRPDLANLVARMSEAFFPIRPPLSPDKRMLLPYMVSLEKRAIATRRFRIFPEGLVSVGLTTETPLSSTAASWTVGHPVSTKAERSTNATVPAGLKNFEPFISTPPWLRQKQPVAPDLPAWSIMGNGLGSR